MFDIDTQKRWPLEEPAGRAIPDHPRALLFTKEAAYLLGISPRTLETLRLRGDGPRFVTVTRKAVRYRRQDLDAWVEGRLRHSTSDRTHEEGAQ